MLTATHVTAKWGSSQAERIQQSAVLTFDYAAG